MDKNKETRIVESDSVKDIAKKLNLNLDEFIIVRDNELVSENVKLKDKDEIKFLSVISGG